MRYVKPDEKPKDRVVVINEMTQADGEENE